MTMYCQTSPNSEKMARRRKQDRHFSVLMMTVLFTLIQVAMFSWVASEQQKMRKQLEALKITLTECQKTITYLDYQRLQGQ